MSGDHKLTQDSKLPSVNGLVEPLVEALIRDAAALRVEVTKGSLGECLIDCGVKAVGGVEAGRRMAEICLGGFGRPLHISVRRIQFAHADVLTDRRIK